MRDHPSRRTWRPAVAAVAASVAVLGAAPAASAHAELITTEPANDSVVDTSPERVSLRFNEPVETAFGAVRVFDADARRVDEGRLERPAADTVGVALEPSLPRGTYTVTWRVVSEDAHPVAGAFVFHVGAAGANPEGIASEVLDSGTPRHVNVLFDVVRFLDFALLLLAVGGTLALALVLRDAGAVRTRLTGALAIASLGLAAVAVTGIVLQGAKAGGFGLADAFNWDVVSAVLETRFGRVALGQAVAAVLLAALALTVRRRGEGAALLDGALIVAGALVLTPALAGHASVSGAVAFVADVAHVQAGAAWVGGLAFLVLALVWAGGERWTLAARAVPRFSTLAVLSVAVLLVAGVVNGYLQVRAWRGLWETTYGLLLLAKVALVLPLLALGAYNNRYAVPRLRAGRASKAEQRRFLRVAGSELALMAAIIAVTAVLVTEPPARAEVAPQGPYATTAQIGDLELNLVVDPAVAGSNQIHLYLTTPTGQPTDVAEATVAATLASRRIGPLLFPTHRAGPGHFIAHGAQLTLAGDWQLRVDTRRGEFDAASATVSVPIRKEP